MREGRVVGEDLGRLLPDERSGVVHGGQVQSGQPGIVRVVEADEGDVLRNAQPPPRGNA